MGAGHNILLVDDDVVFTNLVGRYISNFATLQIAHSIRFCEESQAFIPALDMNLDVLLLDYRLGDVSGLDILQQIRKRGIKPAVIMLTGEGDEEVAVNALKAGAQDYLPKMKLDRDLLVRAITTAMRTVELEEQLARRAVEREELIAKLQQSLDQIKTLSGLLPICSKCKVVRDDKGYWHDVESFIEQRADVQFSHGLCPQCAAAFREELKALRKK